MDPTRKLGELKRRYLQAVPDQVDRLLSHWATYHRIWDAKSAVGLLREVRSLAGASTLLNIIELRETAAPWFRYLKDFLPHESLPGEGVEYCEQNIVCFKGIAEHLRTIDREELRSWAYDNPPEIPFPETHGTGSVYLLEEDPEVCAALSASLTHDGFKVQVFNEFLALYMGFMEDPPSAIVLSSFTAESGPVLDQVAQFRKISESGIPLLLLLDERSGELPPDENLCKLGVVSVHPKPFPPESLGEHVMDALKEDVPEVGTRLLVLEENPFLQEFFTFAMPAGGFPLTVASGEDEARAASLEHFPDLVLFDLDQSGLEAVDTVAALRRDPQWFRIPFLFLTSDTELSMKNLRGMLKSIDGFIDIETSPAQLFELLHKHRSKIL